MIWRVVWEHGRMHSFWEVDGVFPDGTQGYNQQYGNLYVRTTWRDLNNSRILETLENLSK